MYKKEDLMQMSEMDLRVLMIEGHAYLEEDVKEYDHEMMVETLDEIPINIVECNHRYCNRCGNKVSESGLKEYSYQCFTCDEDLYAFETHIKNN